MKHKSLGKRLLNSPVTHFIVSVVGSIVLRLIYATTRVQKIFPDATLPYMRGEKPAIFCFWHGRMIMQPFIKPPGRSLKVLMSLHNDGALINATMRWFGIGSVRGSKKLGSTKALRAMLAITEEGGNIAITPDGPRGPFQQAKNGAAYVAAKTGYPIIPISFSATRHKRFRSWDKFMLPTPFGRVVFVAGQPHHVASDEDAIMAAATGLLEIDITAVTAEADRRCGVDA